MKKIWQRVFSPIIVLALGITLFPVISQAAEYSTTDANSIFVAYDQNGLKPGFYQRGLNRGFVFP